MYDSNSEELELDYLPKLINGKALFQNVESVWVDMPLGLSGAGIVRTIDYAMRIRLRWRKSSIFFPPSYEALLKPNYNEAQKIHKLVYGKGLSKQAWNLKDKISELHDFLQDNPHLINYFKESHPELVFQSEWPHEYPLASKKQHLGYVQRVQIISKYVPDFQEMVESFCKKHPSDVLKKHDAVDAAILALKAASGNNYELNQQPDHDKNGLPFTVVY